MGAGALEDVVAVAGAPEGGGAGQAGEGGGGVGGEQGAQVEDGVAGDSWGVGAHKVDVVREEVVRVVQGEEAGEGKAPVAALGY